MADLPAGPRPSLLPRGAVSRVARGPEGGRWGPLVLLGLAWFLAQLEPLGPLACSGLCKHLSASDTSARFPGRAPAVRRGRALQPLSSASPRPGTLARPRAVCSVSHHWVSLSLGAYLRPLGISVSLSRLQLCVSCLLPPPWDPSHERLLGRKKLRAGGLGVLLGAVPLTLSPASPLPLPPGDPPEAPLLDVPSPSASPPRWLTSASPVVFPVVSWVKGRGCWRRARGLQGHLAGCSPHEGLGPLETKGLHRPGGGIHGQPLPSLSMSL